MESTMAGPSQPTRGRGRAERAPADNRAPVKRRLSVDLSESEHRRFKAACAITDRKMMTELQEFVRRRTVELEEEAKLTQPWS